MSTISFLSCRHAASISFNNVTAPIALYKIVQDPHNKVDRSTIPGTFPHPFGYVLIFSAPERDKVASQNILFDAVINRRLHRDYFNAQLGFMKGLEAISSLLVSMQLRDKALKSVYSLKHPIILINPMQTTHSGWRSVISTKKRIILKASN